MAYKPTLFRRHSVYLPTWPLLTAILFGLTIGITMAFKHAGNYLATTKAIGNGILIVEGWQSHNALKASYKLYQQGNYTTIITTGGPITDELSASFNSYATRATELLIRLGAPPGKIITASAPASAQDRTFLSAVFARKAILEHKLKTTNLEIVSTGAHARRTQALYKLAFPKLYTIGVIAINPERFSLEHWWRTSDGAKTVLSELLSLGWMHCCFSPGPLGSHEEVWGAQ